ncbi:MAG: hypothetical protein ACRCY3_10780 [Sphingorhabdus sp.]
MKRVLAGAGIALIASSLGYWGWQSWAAPDIIIPLPPPEESAPQALPMAAVDAPKFGAPPPEPPRASKLSREEVRFNRYDRNRDELVSRIEMMSSRTKDFKKLDKDGNNLLSFEEWAAATGDRFARADGNRDSLLTRVEFLSTRPKQPPKPACRC